jgi:hypothetical protein
MFGGLLLFGGLALLMRDVLEAAKKQRAASQGVSIAALLMTSLVSLGFWMLLVAALFWIYALARPDVLSTLGGAAAIIAVWGLVTLMASRKSNR